MSTILSKHSEAREGRRKFRSRFVPYDALRRVPLLKLQTAKPEKAVCEFNYVAGVPEECGNAGR